MKESINAPRVTAMDANWTIGGIKNTSINISVKETEALDPRHEIDAGSISLYNAKNYDNAVFTINGHKFVVMVGKDTATSLGENGKDMNATQEFSADVTILIAV